jgi:hypothetical protein
VTVDDTLEALVKEKLQPALKLLRGAEFVEGEGGVMIHPITPFL